MQVSSNKARKHRNILFFPHSEQNILKVTFRPGAEKGKEKSKTVELLL